MLLVVAGSCPSCHAPITASACVEDNSNFYPGVPVLCPCGVAFRLTVSITDVRAASERALALWSLPRPPAAPPRPG